MLCKEDIIGLLKAAGFPPEGYWVVTGAAMVLRDIKKATGDIDLGCTKELADALQQRGYPVGVTEDGNRRIRYSDRIELFENWKAGTIETVNKIPVVSIEGILIMKRQLNREKDRKDIALIEDFIARKK